MRQLSKRNIVCALFLGVVISAQAMELEGEEKSVYPVYVTTKSAVKKTMDKMGIKYTIIEDGDLKYDVTNAEANYGGEAYIIFSKIREKIWNIQFVAQFGTKVSKYDELIKYINDYHGSKREPKLVMVDEDTLRIMMGYPVQYGFNPDEFEENYLLRFNRLIKKIAKETEEWRT